MAECAQCMYENEASAAACEQCGAELSLEVLSLQLGAVCRHCDSYNDPGVKVCISCGEAIGPAGGAEPEPLAAEALDDHAPLAPAELPGAKPWLAPPDATPIPPPRAAPPPPAARPPTASPLPPGALPPGWAAYQQKSPPPAARAAPQGAVPCPHCHAENTAAARFCGTCGVPLVPSGPRSRGRLIVIRGLAGEGRQFPLSDAPNVVGRSEGIAFPEDPYVAARHATFHFRGDELVVRDEGAGNGVYVKLRAPHRLEPGDMLVVGERLLRFRGVQPLPPPPVPPRHGSPRPAERMIVLEELLEGGGTGRLCRRGGPVLTIGRAGCDLNFPSDGFVSARHAELSLAGETAFLRDLGSANGTFLRVPPRTEQTLAHGDYLLLGRELVRVEVAAAR